MPERWFVYRDGRMERRPVSDRREVVEIMEFHPPCDIMAWADSIPPDPLVPKVRTFRRRKFDIPWEKVLRREGRRRWGLLPVPGKNEWERALPPYERRRDGDFTPAVEVDWQPNPLGPVTNLIVGWMRSVLYLEDRDA